MIFVLVANLEWINLGAEVIYFPIPPGTEVPSPLGTEVLSPPDAEVPSPQRLLHSSASATQAKKPLRFEIVALELHICGLLCDHGNLGLTENRLWMDYTTLRWPRVLDSVRLSPASLVTSRLRSAMLAGPSSGIGQDTHRWHL